MRGAIQIERAICLEASAPADQQERNPFTGPQVGPDTQELVDSEIRRIVDECLRLAEEGAP